MYYMVYYESSHGCSSPPEICCADFDTLDEAQQLIDKLRKSNEKKCEDYQQKRSNLDDTYDEIKLCVVLEEFLR